MNALMLERVSGRTHGTLYSPQSCVAHKLTTRLSSRRCLGGSFRLAFTFRHNIVSEVIREFGMFGKDELWRASTATPATARADGQLCELTANWSIGVITHQLFIR
ncbi:hypothetical protein J6590_071337 [Homalodisca vitripennis]|nr:hypothetical protein J6590_071337 [Homalodisca vitripennis]